MIKVVMGSRNKHNQRLITVLFLLVGLGVSAQNGQELFQTKCTACHTIGGGKLVGPDLKDVTSRRSEDWLKKFVVSSQGLIASGDADAKAVYDEFNQTVMPDQAMSDAELGALIGYISDASGGTAAPIVAEEMPAGDAANGKQIFLGLSRLENGGPSCNSCHHVNYEEMLGGGALAKDLTDVYDRMGDGVYGYIQSPVEPMASAYREKTVTTQERADITAFFKEVSQNKAKQVTKDLGNILLMGGLGALTVLLGAFSLIWIRRKRTTVNLRIYERQIKSE